MILPFTLILLALSEYINHLHSIIFIISDNDQANFINLLMVSVYDLLYLYPNTNYIFI